MNMSSALLLLFGCTYMAFCLIFADLSDCEQEEQAARIARATGAFSLVLAAGAVLVNGLFAEIVFWFFMALSAVITFLLFVPFGRKEESPQHSTQRFDEREIMFARMRMQPDSPQFEQYYNEHPEHKELDDIIRAGGWHSRNTRQSQLMEIASEASFMAVGSLRGHVDGLVAEEKKEIPVEQRNAFIAGLAQHFGALEVGFTELKPEHIYSHIGRGAGIWGEEITLNHTHAIAFTVEMRKEHVDPAPRQPIMAESAVQYAHAGLIGIMLAEAIRAMGYEARAHIDGNYQVICPIVARDAGLGEIGRMGLLMTPDYGPRVRLAVVTTTLSLDTQAYEPIEAMIDFCAVCNKCAVNCPSKAIPMGERAPINGALRWQIDQQKCYQYWTKVGTDCGRCMAVCPLSRGDHWMHQLARKAILRSALFRRVYVHLDRWLYGEHPKPKQPPEWQQVKE